MEIRSEDDFGPCDECNGYGQADAGFGLDTCHVCAGTGYVLRDLDETEIAP